MTILAHSFLLWLGLGPIGPGGEGEARRLIAERLPRIVHLGGPYLRRPEVTTVTFTGDDLRLVARLEDFGARITKSPWWADVTDGYCAGNDCIGGGGLARSVRLTRSLPPRVRDVDVEALLSEEVRTGTLRDLGDEALVVIYLPAGVVLRDALHPRYCEGGPRAFHRMLRSGSLSFPYAVVPRCGSEAETTATASHEILEATTNPDPNVPGFRIASGASWIAFTANGAEPADPCGLITLDGHRADEAGFTVQRAWSNRAAGMGGDPCVPGQPDRPYVALIPRKAVVSVSAEADTVVLEADAVSDRAVAAWSVSAVDLTGDHEGQRSVDVSLDRSSVARGDVAVLRGRGEIIWTLQ